MSHYYEKKQTSPERAKEIKAVLRNQLFTFVTASGIFSGAHVDAGTWLLVETCIVPQGGSVLDLGCGYGVVGIVLKKVFRELDVFLVDINERAISLAEKNAQLNSVVPHIMQGSMYEPVHGMLFDAILVNPPYVAGRAIVFAMLEDAPKHLKKKGLLQVVARHQKGGKVIAQKMKFVFGNVIDHARKGGYHVYVSVYG